MVLWERSEDVITNIIGRKKTVNIIVGKVGSEKDEKVRISELDEVGSDKGEKVNISEVDSKDNNQLIRVLIKVLIRSIWKKLIRWEHSQYI